MLSLAAWPVDVQKLPESCIPRGKTQIVKVLSEGRPTTRMGPKRRKTAHGKINIKIKILCAHLIGHSENISGICRLKPIIGTSILQNSQCKLLP